MAFVFRFTSPGMTAAKYDEIVKRLAQAGAGSPPGRLFHVSFGDKENLRVSDIWDTRENFERFGQTLKPIMQDLGIEMGTPEIVDVYNIIEGVKVSTAEP